jgi:GT2 family glycosyltransferase
MVDLVQGSVGVIVVNYGSSALLAENLVPLGRALPEAQIVVVDNLTSAAERSAVVALAEAEGWSVELPDSNTGFGVGVNLGAARALRDGAEWLLILNPDATIEATAARQLVARASAAPLTLWCPTILRPDGSVWFDGADLHLADGRLRNPRHRPVDDWEPWLTGACLVASRALWELVGGFDDDYFLYWEDVDLSHRVLLAGGAVVVCDDIVATHAEGGTQGEGHASAGLRKSDTYYYFTIRNRLLFAGKHLDDAGLARWLANARAVAWETLLQGGRRQFLTSLSPLLAARRALRDGRRLARVNRL